MNRRSYLRTAGLAGAASLAGCLGGFGDDDPNVVLGAPDRDADVTSEDLPYPGWGQQVPDVELPDPLAGEPVALRDVERPHVTTFFFSNCMTVCPAIVGLVREIQIHSVNEGYADQVDFYPVTFDPARDDAETLRAYADRMNVDMDAGNWHFLRPETEARAKAVVQEQFGVFFEKDPQEDGPYMFTHLGLILLVNADGYVERAYRARLQQGEGLTVNRGDVLEDLRRVRTA
jgi:protein SCO1/2